MNISSENRSSLNFDTITSGGIVWFVKLDWLLFTTAAALAITITVLYWGGIYWQLDIKPNLLIDFHMHAINTVIILIELSLGAMPVHLLHVVCPMGFGLLYALCNFHRDLLGSGSQQCYI